MDTKAETTVEQTFLTPGKKTISFELETKTNCYFADLRKETVKNMFANSGAYGNSLYVPPLIIELSVQKQTPLYKRAVQRYANQYSEEQMRLGGGRMKIERYSNSCRRNGY